MHEIPIEKFFHGIKTYKQLTEKHLNKEKIKRINTLTNELEDKELEVRLFKMSSVGNNAEQ